MTKQREFKEKVRARMEKTGENYTTARREILKASQPKSHCFAKGCKVAVPRNKLMCLKHWHMVPPDIQKRVWAEAKKMWANKENTWRQAATEARYAVAEKEGL